MTKTIFKNVLGDNNDNICELKGLIQPNKIIYLKKDIDEFNSQKYDMYEFVDSVDFIIEGKEEMLYERHIYVKNIQKNTKKVF